MFDARVPVAFGTAADALDGDAVLYSAALGAPGHVPGCACCAPRTPLAQDLNRLFLQRARGEAAYFRRVLIVADAAGEADARAVLSADPFASARFRAA